MKPTFTYKVIVAFPSEKVLDELGKEGWQLVQVIQEEEERGFYHYFVKADCPMCDKMMEIAENWDK